MLVDPENCRRRVRFRLGGVEGSGDPLSAGIRPEFRFRQGAGSATTGGEHVRKQRLVAAGITMLAATLALSACGSRSESGGGASGGSEQKVAKIGVIAPLSGDLSALGLGIRNSVDLAIRQANDKNLIPGWKLELDAQDDQATPDVGKNAATKLAGDDDVVGVVGTLNSSVSQSVQPVLNSAKISMVSPANTNPSLTQGADFATSKKRTYPSYFRTATT